LGHSRAPSSNAFSAFEGLRRPGALQGQSNRGYSRALPCLDTVFPRPCKIGSNWKSYYVAKPALNALPLRSRPGVFTPTMVARLFSSAKAAHISPALDVCSFTRISLACGMAADRDPAQGGLFCSLYRYGVYDKSILVLQIWSRPRAIPQRRD